MPPQQAGGIDLASFPDQAGKAGTGTPGRTAIPSITRSSTPAVDLTSFPDQPNAAKQPDKQILGASTKPATITKPENLLDFGKRQAKAFGRTVKESLPMVGGATGAAIGGTLAAPTAAFSGPAGPAMGAVVGAGVGGMLGRYAQSLIDRFQGAPAQSASATAKDVGDAGTSQMVQEMGGRIVAAPLGFIRRGGFLKNNGEVMSTLREDKALGTKLSGPEIASGSMTGDIGKAFQSYAAGAFAGGPMQRAIRESGSANAFKQVDNALALLGHPGVGGGPTSSSRGTAFAARRFVGELLDQAADKAPPIDVKSIKQMAAQELEKGIVQHLKAVPDVADPKLAAIIRQIREDPSLIQRMPRPELSRVADAILEKFKSPSMQLLKRVMGMEDETAARGVWEELKTLRGKSTGFDQLYAKNDAQRIATMLQGQLREGLGKAAPDFGKALGQYRDLVRGDYLRSSIVLGNHPVPTKEADADKILTTMGERLRKAVESGRIAKQFDDATGQQVIRNLTRVARVMEKRTQPMAGNIRKIFEIGRIINVGLGLVSGHPTLGTAQAAATWEAFPDFFIWLVHDPKATDWFIQGVQAKNPNLSSGAIIRLMEAYRQAHQQTTNKPKSGAKP